MIRAFIGLLPLLILAACTGGAEPSRQSVTDRDTFAACRQQANMAYNLQNRDDIYRIYDTASPQSGTGLTQSPTRGLADSYSQQQMVQDCIRNTGTQTSRGGSSPASGTANPAGALAPSGSLSR